MPFLGKNMTPIGGNSRAGQVASQNAPMGWGYQSATDANADLLSTGYFDPFNKQLVAGQFIYAHLTDGDFFFTVLSVDRFLKQVFINPAFFSASENVLDAFVISGDNGGIAVDENANFVVVG